LPALFRELVQKIFINIEPYTLRLKIEILSIVYGFSNPTDWAIYPLSSPNHGHAVEDGYDATPFSDETDI